MPQTLPDCSSGGRRDWDGMYPDSRSQSLASQAQTEVSEGTDHEPEDQYLEKAYQPLHQMMVKSLFQKGDTMENSNLAPNNIVRFREDGGTVIPEFVEPWTGVGAAIIRGVAWKRRQRARQLNLEGRKIASQAELASANTIDRTLNSVETSHAQETKSPVEIRTDIHKSLVQNFRLSPSVNLEKKSFDQLVETYNSQQHEGSKFDQDTMRVAFSHLLFALGDKERWDREKQMQEAQLARVSREQAWMQQHT